MYGYTPQGNQFGASYATPSAAATAAAVVSAYGVQQQQATQQQAAAAYGFGDYGSSAAQNAYAAQYGASVAPSAYQYAAQQSLSSAPAQQAAYQAQTRSIGDAYAAASQSAAAAANLAFSNISSSAANAYSSLRSNASSNNTGVAAAGYLSGNRQSGAANPSYQSTGLASQNTGSRQNNTGTGASNYSGYDAAVYAAASSYLQSKATGQSNTWMNKKSSYSSNQGNGGARSFPNKRFGAGNNASGGHRDVQQFYCEVCKISCAGQLTYKEHLEGQRHKKKEALAKGENSVALPKSKVSFRCDLCNVTCTGQDTYQAHVRGAKHQKTLNLCKKLGKPIPANEPTIIPPSELGGTVPPPAKADNKNAKKVVGVPTVNFVAGSKLSTTEAADKKAQVLAAVGSAGAGSMVAGVGKGTSDQVEALIAAEQSLKPVGEEYVEAQRDATGKLITYNCKLCDCKFSDPNAKEIHLKGRRHRMQYKIKVYPELEVDVKQTSRGRAPKGLIPRAQGPYAYFGPPVAMPMGNFPRPWFGSGERRFESSDDRHVQAKHAEIYPDDEQLQSVDKLVNLVEKALKSVSDHLAENGKTSGEGEKIADENKEAIEVKEEDRLLKGVMRVGLLAKQLLLKGDKQVELVVVCSKVPTVAILNEVAALLPQKVESKVDIRTDVPEACIWVSEPDGQFMCKLTFTSRALREEASDGAAPPARPPVPSDALPEPKCLAALAQLRHAKWFQARCIYLQSCQVTLRIMRDVRKRLPHWEPLTDWMTELLVEKILGSSGSPLSVGDALRRVFEAVSSGILFNSGPGLVDPCEKEKVDVLSKLTGQQREDITSSAQHALRMIAFNQLYSILGITRITEPSRPVFPIGPNGDRKRPAPATSSNSVEDVKKDKKDDDLTTAVTKMEV